MKTLRGAAAALLFVSAIAATPALAQSGGSAGIGSARSKVGPPLPRTYPGGSIGSIGGPGWSHGGSDRPRWRDRCRMRSWCRDRWGWGYGYGQSIGYDRMIAGGEYGYFNQGGDEPSVENGRPRYDYDRGYPYEHYRGGDDSRIGEGEHEYADRSRSCETQPTRDRRTGRRVEVRVCRN